MMMIITIIIIISALVTGLFFPGSICLNPTTQGSSFRLQYVLYYV